MSVYKRGKMYGIGYSPDGKKWVRRIVGDTKKMAIEAEREVRRKISREKYLGIIEPKKMYFEKLCEEYLEYSQSQKERTTFVSDKSLVNKLRKRFQGKVLHEITLLDVEKYMNQRKKEVTGATVNREISCLKHMFNKAVDWDYLKENTLKIVRRFKEAPGRLRYLNDDEVYRLINSCPNHLKPIVVIAINTGMRRGEILNLKWQDIDLQNRTICLRKTKNNEVRVIDINDTLYSELRRIRRELGSQFVFVNKNGKPYRDIKSSFKTALKDAGITDFHFHDLRHHFCSRLVMAGVDIRTVQELVGHKDIKMTMRYSHLSDKHKKEAVRKLDYAQIRHRENKRSRKALEILRMRNK